jgi:hypothetical protein
VTYIVTEKTEFQTPKYTTDWYVKWIATLFIVAAVTCRSAGLYFYDLIFSILGTVGWSYVALVWRDRAMIVLNVVLGVVLLMGLAKYLA